MLPVASGQGFSVAPVLKVSRQSAPVSLEPAGGQKLEAALSSRYVKPKWVGDTGTLGL